MVRLLGIGLAIGGMVGVEAKDFGVQGTTYPVIEESLLEHVKRQLAHLPEATLRMKQLEVQERVKHSVVNPTPVSGLHKATTYRQFTLDKDIVDHQGRVIATKATRYNPLDTTQLNEALLVFDGNDPEQVAWAVKHKDPTKWILTAGRPFDLMKQYDCPVYFDQGGAMCRHFRITAVPAVVRQNGHVLEIEEGFKQSGEPHAH
jgi:conjugal transfer pilus assembly protein TraW